MIQKSRIGNHELVEHFGLELERMNSKNVLALLDGYLKRADISEELKKINCSVVIFVGAFTSLVPEAEHIHSLIRRGLSDYVEVEDVGALISEEMPHYLFLPLQNFLNGLVSNSRIICADCFH